MTGDIHRTSVAQHFEGALDIEFERRIREVASIAVAHVKRGDRVTIVTASGHRLVCERSRGLDPLLRFLALLELTCRPEPAVGFGGKATVLPERAA